MKKLENFERCLTVLETANFEFANDDDIYRTGVIGQFSLTFELAWKALQGALMANGVIEAETGSPREIMQLGYKHGFIEDSAVWIDMLQKRNEAVHIYDGERVRKTLALIRDRFIPAFGTLAETLRVKMAEAGGDWK